MTVKYLWASASQKCFKMPNVAKRPSVNALQHCQLLFFPTHLWIKPGNVANITDTKRIIFSVRIISRGSFYFPFKKQIIMDVSGERANLEERAQKDKGREELPVWSLVSSVLTTSSTLLSGYLSGLPLLTHYF